MNIDWKTFGIFTSIFINFIFAILLLFKSALNEILKDWWIEKKNKKKLHTERLIDFKTKFNTQQSQCLLLIVTLAQKQASLIMGKPALQFIEDSHQNCLTLSSEARNSISEFLDYLPIELINSYKRYDAQLADIIENIMREKVSKEDVLDYSSQMINLSQEITNLTDSILRQELKN